MSVSACPKPARHRRPERSQLKDGVHRRLPAADHPDRGGRAAQDGNDHDGQNWGRNGVNCEDTGAPGCCKRAREGLGHPACPCTCYMWSQQRMGPQLVVDEVTAGE